MKSWCARMAVLSCGAMGSVFACSTFGAGDDATDGGAPAALEASVPDGAPTGGDAAPEASRSFCDGVDAQFCWSFDDAASPLGTQLQPLPAADGGAYALTDAARSAPFALQATYEGAGFGSSGVILVDQVDASSGITCEADIRIDQLVPSDPLRPDQFSVVAVRFYESTDATGSATLVFRSLVAGKRVTVAIGSGGPDAAVFSEQSLGDQAAGDWLHFVLDLDATGFTGRVGAGVGVKIPRNGPSYPNAVDFAANCGGGACTVSFDNLVCRSR